MNKISLVFLCFSISVIGNAQKNITSNLEINKLKPLDSYPSSMNAKQQLKPAESDSVILNRLNQQIQAVHTKIAYIKNDQTLNERALQEGWFDKMNQYLTTYEARKKTVLERMQKKAILSK